VGFPRADDRPLDRFIQTKILSATVVDHLKKANTEFAEVEDCAVALMRIVSDPNIAGMHLFVSCPLPRPGFETLRTRN
jgi:hypothetical protein